MDLAAASFLSLFDSLETSLLEGMVIMMIKHSKITLAAGLILALALAGCGGDDTTNPGGGSTGDSFDQATAIG
jgi:hypothetical protein